MHPTVAARERKDGKEEGVSCRLPHDVSARFYLQTRRQRIVLARDFQTYTQDDRSPIINATGLLIVQSRSPRTA